MKVKVKATKEPITYYSVRRANGGRAMRPDDDPVIVEKDEPISTMIKRGYLKVLETIKEEEPELPEADTKASAKTKGKKKSVSAKASLSLKK